MTETALSLVADLALATLRGTKTRTMRPITSQNSAVDGRASRALFDSLDWGSTAIFVDKGPSPAGNEGPYLHVPHRTEDSTHRVYSRRWIGDVLWIREPAKVIESRGFLLDVGRQVKVRYEADVAEAWVDYPARLSTPTIGHFLANGVHREGARTLVRLKAVKPQRPVDITEEEAIAEGVTQRAVPPFEDVRRLSCTNCGQMRSQHVGQTLVCFGSAGRSFAPQTLRGGFLWLYQGIYGPESLTRWSWVYEWELLATSKETG